LLKVNIFEKAGNYRTFYWVEFQKLHYMKPTMTFPCDAIIY